MLVDDHALLRRGVRELLGELMQDAEFVELDSGEAAGAAFGEDGWDLVVLDLAMPGRGGLDALQQLHRQRPDVPIIVLSASEDEQYAVRAIRAGACGYVTKRCADVELVHAAQRAISGARYVSSTIRDRLADAALEVRRPPHESLSDRELQVLRMLGLGKSVRDIAEELALSESTISTYRVRILAKLELGSNAELMRYALRAGLVE